MIETAIPIDDYHEVNYLKEKFKYIDKRINCIEELVETDDFIQYFCIAYTGRKPSKRAIQALIEASL